MVKCSVKHHHSAIIVTFEDNKTLLLQSDCDQAGFAVDCGLIATPKEQDETLNLIGESWEGCELEDIEECPFVYYELAE